MEDKLTTRLVRSLQPQSKSYEVCDTELRGFRLRVLPSGQKAYFFLYRTPHGRRRFRLGDANALTIRQARDFAEQQAARVALGEDIQAVRQSQRVEAQQAKARTLGGFLVHHYGPWVRASRKDGVATLARLRACFDQWFEYPLHELTPWIVEKWRSEQLERGKVKSTVNRDLTALKALLSSAVDWGVIDEHPLAKLQPLKTDTRAAVRYLSHDETTHLRSVLTRRDTRMQAERERGNAWRRVRGYHEFPSLQGQSYGDHLTPMLLLSLNTGLRRGELFNLRWHDIDVTTKTLTVEGTGAKSGQTRHMPLNAEALAVLQTWRRQTHDNDLVFPGKDGECMTSVKKAWAGILKEARITNFRWHDLRHDFASRLVMAGVPLNTVRELLGHATLNTTLRYAHLAPDHKAEAVNRLSPG